MRLFRRWRGGIFSRGDQFTARDGMTALMYPCEKGDIECARLLVEKGADMNAQNKSAIELCVWWRRSFRPGAAFPFGWRRILGVGEVRSGLGKEGVAFSAWPWRPLVHFTASWRIGAPVPLSAGWIRLVRKPSSPAGPERRP